MGDGLPLTLCGLRVPYHTDPEGEQRANTTDVEFFKSDNLIKLTFWLHTVAFSYPVIIP